jgi:uncharacterized membrane protein YphA (DoxX/SURF4 family)
MNIALWIVQGLLAVAFAGAGFLKLTKPKAELQPKMSYVEDFSDGTIKLIGATELLAAIGLILPWATGILPVLTPLAASGLVLVMVLAAVVHVRRKEYSAILFNAVLGGLALFVALNRF